MVERVWLASYPKSGNTWMRILIGALLLKDGESIDINRLPLADGIASARAPFDYATFLESGLLTFDEIDCLRPRVYEKLVQSFEEEIDIERLDAPSTRFVKVHDAYTLTPLGEPLLAGSRGARGAIVIVRDPRDVAPSLANHNGSTIDAAIDFMNDVDGAFSAKPGRQSTQLRQWLPTWSGHIESWLDQRDIPIHLVRYEDLKRDTARVFTDAMAFVGRPITFEQAERAARMADFAQLRDQEREKGFVEASRAGAAFFRRGDTGAWRHELTLEQVQRIESAHGAMMARLGYDRLGAGE